MKIALIALIFIQGVINYMLFQQINRTKINPVVSSQTKQDTKPRPVKKINENQPATTQEIYVYTLEVNEDLRKLSTVVYGLQDQIAALSTQKPVAVTDTSISKKIDVAFEAEELSADFDQLDVDQSGKLSMQEGGFSKETLAQLDLNNDGKVSRSELNRYATFKEKAQQHANQKDKQGGSFPIEKSQYRGDQKRFTYVDKDQDGWMTEEEYIAFRAEGLKERRRFDQNHDGHITLEEFGQGEVRFKQMDRNGDGKIEEHEVRQAIYKGYW